MLEVSSMLKNETTAMVMPKRPAFSIKTDEDERNNSGLQQVICSNEATVSQILPR